MAQQRAAIVTGAGSGIGLATSARLAREGYALALVGRRGPVLADAAAEIARVTGVSPSRLVSISADVSRPEDIDRVVDHTTTTLGGIDVLVNNAGLGEVLPIPRTDWDALRRVFDLNALGVGYLIHRAWPSLYERRGCIVNVSSYAALDPFDGFFAYGATKAAVNLMTISASREGAARAVRAFSVAPGAVETPLLRTAFGEDIVPRHACLTPDDVAAVIGDCVAGRRDADNGRTIYLRRDESGGVHEQVLDR